MLTPYSTPLLNYFHIRVLVDEQLARPISVSLFEICFKGCLFSYFSADARQAGFEYFHRYMTIIEITASSPIVCIVSCLNISPAAILDLAPTLLVPFVSALPSFAFVSLLLDPNAGSTIFDMFTGVLLPCTQKLSGSVQVAL